MIIRCLAVLLAASCGGAAPPVVYYDLLGAASPAHCPNPGGPTVAVTSLAASATANSAEIAIRSTGGQIEHYLYHRWQGAAPELVTEALAAALSESGYFGRVRQDDGIASADIELTGRILRFEGARRRGARSVARVVLDLTARARDDRTFTRRYSREVTITERSVDALVDSLRRAVVDIARHAAPELAALASASASRPRRCRPEKVSLVRHRRLLYKPHGARRVLRRSAYRRPGALR